MGQAPRGRQNGETREGVEEFEVGKRRDARRVIDGSQVRRRLGSGIVIFDSQTPDMGEKSEQS